MLEIQSKLSIQKFVFHLQPAKATLKSLDKLCTRLRDTSGGKMLDELFNNLLEQVVVFVIFFKYTLSYFSSNL